MALTNAIIQQKLIEKFGDQVSHFETPFGLLSFQSPKALNLKVLQFLYEDEHLQFTFLTDLCAVHYPDKKGEELAVVYHLHNLKENIRIRY
ncbi:MAG: NADH-quinone oxidoreductase subunit C, partial [Bacteroidota bacterium]|nr:NADH-quinone oxidoreductase subunit C [Bacteroidota bacterium]